MLNKFFGFFRKSDDELRKEFVVREIDNNDEVPAYEDSNVALYEEVRQVANIKHACELDAEILEAAPEELRLHAIRESKGESLRLPFSLRNHVRAACGTTCETPNVEDMDTPGCVAFDKLRLQG